ncbi:rRNA maturation RNAse YbeY [Mycoplasmopsis cynos]|nr:rRNA maturation RNAse YbeY [Mycoplasmopsis cynos]WAM06427.1 rRNA maturation RNAse YbeY [Mycoplasmopsis cynos]
MLYNFTMFKYQLNININNKIKAPETFENEMEKILQNFANYFKLDRKKQIMLDVSIVSRNEIRILNKEYRNKDYITDILSFDFRDDDLYSKLLFYPFRWTCYLNEIELKDKRKNLITQLEENTAIYLLTV